MRFPRQRGSTSVMVRIFIPDNSVTTGAGCAGLTYASTNLVITFSREKQNGFTVITGSNILAITTPGTWLDPGTGKVRFGLVDTTRPGLYEIQFPDNCAAFAVGNGTDQNVIIDIYEATTTALKIGPCSCLIPLVPWDYQDGVRMGLTALPNAAAGASGGLPLSVDTSGRVDMLKVNGTSQTARDLGASVLLSPGTGAGQLDITSGVVKANLSQILGTALTETAGYLAAAFKKFFNVATPTGTVNSLPDAVAGATGGVAIVGSVMGKSPATLAAGDVSGNLPADVVNWKGATAPAMTGDAYARLGTAGAGLTALGDTRIANLDTTVSSRAPEAAGNVAAIKAKTDNLPADPADQSAIEDAINNKKCRVYSKIL